MRYVRDTDNSSPGKSEEPMGATPEREEGPWTDAEKINLSTLAQRYRDVLTGQGCSPLHIETTHRHICQIIDLMNRPPPASISRSAVELALGQIRARPHHPSLRTLNHYLTSFRAFCRWCADDDNGYMPADPTRSIKKFKQRKDPRHTRRALDDGELARLMEAAEGCDLTLYALSGHDWAERWHLFVASGLREGTVRQLRVGQFELKGAEPGVKILAQQEPKRSSDRFVPLHPASAERIGAYLACKMPSALAFPLPRKEQVLAALRVHLKLAGINPFDLLPGPNQTRRRVNVVDVHSLRVTCGTRMALCGVAVKHAQEVLGHADSRLTLDIYTRVQQRETSGAISKMSPLPRGKRSG